jgi:hypothetical protein
LKILFKRSLRSIYTDTHERKVGILDTNLERTIPTDTTLLLA